MFSSGFEGHCDISLHMNIFFSVRSPFGFLSGDDEDILVMGDSRPPSDQWVFPLQSPFTCPRQAGVIPMAEGGSKALTLFQTVDNNFL